jgi:hypothetical protein
MITFAFLTIVIAAIGSETV